MPSEEQRAADTHVEAPLIREEPPRDVDTGVPEDATIWSIGAAIGIVTVMVVMTVIAGIGIGLIALLGLGETASALLGGTGMAVVYLVVLAIVWGVARGHGVGFKEAVCLRAVPARTVLAYGLGVALGARLVGSVWAAMLAAFDVRVPGSDLDPTRVFGDGPAGAAMMVLVGVVLAPVVEEVVFRGVLLPALRVKWGVAPAVLVSSAVFALVHVSLFAIPPIFVLALMLSASLLNARSLWVPIVGHAAFNAIGIGALYLLRGLGVM